MIIVTNGGIQTVRKTLPDKKYIRKRKHESVNFAEKYGLNKHQIHFLNFSDGELKIIKINKIFELISKYIEKDDIICSPSIFEKHPDHKQIAKTVDKLPNKKIYYSVITNMPNSRKISMEKVNKLKLFKKFYPSQHWRLTKNNFLWRNYEEYSEKT